MAASCGRCSDGTAYKPGAEVAREIVQRIAPEIAQDRPQTAPPSSAVTWVDLPGGAFRMGSDSGSPDQKPVHRVAVPSFQMAETETTQAQYKACVDADACDAPNCDWDPSRKGHHPVTCVDWNGSKAFCEWAGARLCSESEWEYAARSAGKDQAYPWGNAPATCRYAVMSDGGDGCGASGSKPSCSKTQGNSDQGICDLAGSVWEWVQDWYHSSYTGAPPDGSAWEAPIGSYRVARGGGWYFVAAYLTATNRVHDFPSDFVHASLGFRCCR